MCSEAYWRWTLAENQRKLIPEVRALDSESSAPNPREFNPHTNGNFLDGLSEHDHTKEEQAPDYKKVSTKTCTWLLNFNFPSVFSPSFHFLLQKIHNTFAKIKLLEIIHHNSVLPVVLCTNQTDVRLLLLNGFQENPK